MKPSTKKYELKFLRMRNAIERKAIAMTKKAIREQYQFIVDKIKTTDKSQWDRIPETLPDSIIQELFNKIYPMTAPLGVMERNHLMQGKSDADDKLYLSDFQRRLSLIAQTIAGEKIVTITNTTKQAGLKVIREVLDNGDTQGWGIDKITSEIYKEMGANLRGNGYARAKAIAQTEIISASNQASEYAASSTGYDYLKFWSTSGLENIRESHLEAERYSDEKGGLKPDETFPNGLLYPGDPNGPPEEVINCRCTLMHEII